MKIAVCDDEEYFVKDILERIEKHGVNDIWPNQFDGYTDPDLFLRNYSDQMYDLVYLDIGFENVSGITLAYKIKKINRKCMIIFVTCHDSYVRDSHRLEALQYIEKPVSDEIFNEELERAIKKYKSKTRAVEFQITTGDKLVKTANIIYLETSYTTYKLYLSGNETHYGSYKSVKKTKKELIERYFFRLNRSIIINLNYVDSYTTNSITMSNGDILPLTKARKAEFKKQYFDFMDQDDFL